MAISFQMRVEGDLLLVEASGWDESLEEVLGYGKAVVDAAVRGGCRRILCNEAALEYRLNTLDTFKAAAFIADYAPHVAQAALVCSPGCAADALFWETVASNRGLRVRAFRNVDAAWSWLGLTPAPVGSTSS